EISEWSKQFIIERVEAHGVPLKELISTLNQYIETDGGKFRHLRLSCTDAAGAKKIVLVLKNKSLHDINTIFIPGLTQNWMGYSSDRFVFFDQSQFDNYRNSLVFDSDFKAQDNENWKKVYNERLATSMRTWKSPVPLSTFSHIEKRIEDICKIEDLGALRNQQIRLFRIDHKAQCVDIDLAQLQKISYQWPEAPKTEALPKNFAEWIFPLLRSKKEYQNLMTEMGPRLGMEKTDRRVYVIESNIDYHHLV